MALPAMSIILYTALQSMQPCEKVFADTAKAANPTFKSDEQAYLEEFAKASCETSNPDILWLLALQETNFRFVIVRQNRGQNFKITQGAEAIRTLKELKMKSRSATPPSLNVDIGVMQFNWRWHGQAFGNDPLSAISPKRQVNYFLEKYSRTIYSVCEKGWVGCYHNQSNVKLSTQYQKDITKKTRTLADKSLTFLREHRGQLNGEILGTLPPVIPSDIFKNFAYVRSFPRPLKQTFNKLLADVAVKKTVRGAIAATK